ncbi:Fpg/Nei family DNA glycosylase [Stieleria varia]|uniref:DNA-(apurinic or apyrimidinic site) lyase n=1 Tax=Stieleria varia TaxID=2528005 RepID=A0A5C6B6H1_9BACT|nr:DNA glycosylase [Stieleria varia]TWU06114.1 Endonuclease 8 1 [Stieleria varia]
MPEGHKTHWIARRHDQMLRDQVIRVTSPQGRFRSDARNVSGKTLTGVHAAGKHLFYEFEGQRIVHIHLGRYGKYREHKVPPPPPVGQVRLRMIGTQACIDLNGPTTCRVITLETRDEIVSKLGPDPLAGGRKSVAWDSISVSKKPIGALLLDQSVIAGVGNIFRAELLYEIGMDPNKPGNALTKPDFDHMWKVLTRMMKTGLKYGKIITVTASEAGKPISQLADSERFRVYRQPNCPGCDFAIETTDLASRKLYWCPHCQSQARQAF